MSDDRRVRLPDGGDGEDVRVVVPRTIVTRPVDDRGRVSIGTEHAGKRVTVAVLDVLD